MNIKDQNNKLPVFMRIAEFSKNKLDKEKRIYISSNTYQTERYIKIKLYKPYL